MSRNGINVHCIAEDAKTSISSCVNVPVEPTLMKLLLYVGANGEEIVEVETDLLQRGAGSVFVTLKSGRKNLQQISPVHAKKLDLR